MAKQKKFRMLKSWRSPVCCVVDTFCRRPANLCDVDNMMPLATGCVKCNQSVCTECSSLRAVAGYGRTRVCNNCQVDMNGGEDFVLARMRRRAGLGVYPAAVGL